MSAPNTTTPASVIVKRRRAKALELRAQGFNYREIADLVISMFGPDAPTTYDERYAWRDVMEELRKIDVDMHESASEVRQLEVQRLDEMMAAMYARAVAGNEKAVDRVLRIMDRRAKLLGLDSPQQVKVDDWRSQILDLLRSGRVTIEQIRKELGDGIVAELLESRSLPALTSGEVTEGEFKEIDGETVAGSMLTQRGQSAPSIPSSAESDVGR